LGLIIDRVAGTRRWPAALWIIPTTLVVLASILRPYVSLNYRESVYNSRVLAELRSLRPALEARGPESVLAGPFEANIAVLSTRGGQLFHFDHTGDSSLIPDREVHERHALNAWLQGHDEATYRPIALEKRFQVGPVVTNPEWKTENVVATRIAILREIQADPGPFLDRYRPTTLLLPTVKGVPARGGAWRRLAGDDRWTLWEREPETPTGSTAASQELKGRSS
jgi:hypothetical protein